MPDESESTIRMSPEGHSSTKLPRRRARSDDILNLIRDFWRRGQISNIEPDADFVQEISPDMTIDRLRRKLGGHKQTFDWREMSAWLGGLLPMSISSAEWKRVLVPGDRRTLRDALELMSQRATIEAFPRTRDGQPLTWVESAYEVLLVLLRRRGIDVSSITLESRLSPIIGDAMQVFTEDLSRVVPGRIPPITTSRMLWIILLILISPIALNLFLEVQPWFPWPYTIEPMWFFLLLPLMYVFPWKWLPRGQFKLGELVTVQDLCYFITSPPPHGEDDLIPPSSEGDA